MYVRLADGAQLLIRPIRPDDKPLLTRGLHELSDQSAQRRFLVPKQRFTTAELRYLTELDGHDHVALVAVSPSEPDHLVAVARFVRLADEPETAEAAIVVLDSWQRRGVGSALVRALADEALAHGIRRFAGMILSDNVPALRLMDELTRYMERSRRGVGGSELISDLAA